MARLPYTRDASPQNGQNAMKIKKKKLTTEELEKVSGGIGDMGVDDDFVEEVEEPELGLAPTRKKATRKKTTRKKATRRS